MPDGGEIAVAVRRSLRARRILLQVDPIEGAAELVLPPRAGFSEAASFARSKAGWLAGQIGRAAGRVLLDHGAVVPLLGTPRRVVWAGEGRRAVAVEDDRLLVTGPRPDVPVRLYTWLRRRAADELGVRTRARAGALGRRVTRVTVRDTRSRWGSCTAAGHVSFSWRLILAPEPVLDYVVAHEVAHLVHLDHGPAFWSVVETLASEPRAARRWLRANGAALHRYVHRLD